MAVVILAPFAWLAERQTQGQACTRAVTVFFAFSLLGLLGMLSQIRFVVLAAAAIPTLTGYVVYTFLKRSVAGKHRPLGMAAVVVSVSLTLLFPWTQTAILSWSRLPELSTVARGDVWADDCRNIESLKELSQFPPGVVLAPDPIGSSLLLVTNHTIIAAPYHRSEVAMGNIEIPFMLPKAEFRALIESHGVNYVVMCKLLEKGPKNSFFRELAMGTERNGFQRLALSEDSPLIAYRVVD